MKIERLGRHMIAERLPVERQVGKRERHVLSPVRYQSNGAVRYWLPTL
jgi:hypothetical protein